MPPPETPSDLQWNNGTFGDTGMGGQPYGAMGNPQLVAQALDARQQMLMQMQQAFILAQMQQNTANADRQNQIQMQREQHTFRAWELSQQLMQMEADSQRQFGLGLEQLLSNYSIESAKILSQQNSMMMQLANSNKQLEANIRANEAQFQAQHGLNVEQFNLDKSMFEAQEFANPSDWVKQSYYLRNAPAPTGGPIRTGRVDVPYNPTGGGGIGNNTDFSRFNQDSQGLGLNWRPSMQQGPGFSVQPWQPMNQQTQSREQYQPFMLGGQDPGGRLTGVLGGEAGISVKSFWPKIIGMEGGGIVGTSPCEQIADPNLRALCMQGQTTAPAMLPDEGPPPDMGGVTNPTRPMGAAAQPGAPPNANPATPANADAILPQQQPKPPTPESTVPGPNPTAPAPEPVSVSAAVQAQSQQSAVAPPPGAMAYPDDPNKVWMPNDPNDPYSGGTTWINTGGLWQTEGRPAAPPPMADFNFTQSDGSAWNQPRPVLGGNDATLIGYQDPSVYTGQDNGSKNIRSEIEERNRFMGAATAYQKSVQEPWEKAMAAHTNWRPSAPPQSWYDKWRGQLGGQNPLANAAPVEAMPSAPTPMPAGGPAMQPRTQNGVPFNVPGQTSPGSDLTLMPNANQYNNYRWTRTGNDTYQGVDPSTGQNTPNFSALDPNAPWTLAGRTVSGEPPQQQPGRQSTFVAPDDPSSGPYAGQPMALPNRYGMPPEEEEPQDFMGMASRFLQPMMQMGRRAFGREAGGPSVGPGQPIIVGESGPEMMIPPPGVNLQPLYQPETRGMAPPQYEIAPANREARIALEGGRQTVPMTMNAFGYEAGGMTDPVITTPQNPIQSPGIQNFQPQPITAPTPQAPTTPTAPEQPAPAPSAPQTPTTPLMPNTGNNDFMNQLIQLLTPSPLTPTTQPTPQQGPTPQQQQQQNVNSGPNGLGYNFSTFARMPWVRALRGLPPDTTPPPGNTPQPTGPAPTPAPTQPNQPQPWVNPLQGLLPQQQQQQPAGAASTPIDYLLPSPNPIQQPTPQPGPQMPPNPLTPYLPQQPTPGPGPGPGQPPPEVLPVEPGPTPTTPTPTPTSPPPIVDNGEWGNYRPPMWQQYGGPLSLSLMPGAPQLAPGEEPYPFVPAPHQIPLQTLLRMSDTERQMMMAYYRALGFTEGDMMYFFNATQPGTNQYQNTRWM